VKIGFIEADKVLISLKKFCHVDKNMAKLFYILTLFPKLHIFATRCQKSGILTIFGPILAILEDFLTEKARIV
jgi:hypothetical protein